MFTGQDLVDVTYATVWWSALGCLVTGLASWIAAVGFVVGRRRERRRSTVRRRWVSNAVIGAVAAMVLSFIPFAQVLGGIVAGYLERGDRVRNVWVGALSGVFAALPIMIVLGFLSVGLVRGTSAAAAFDARVLVVGVMVATVLGGVLVSAVLGAIGGYLGGTVFTDSTDG